MKHFFNEVNVFFGFIGGSLSYLLGGFDYLLQFLVLLMVIDFVTGFAKSFFNHNLDKEKIFVGAYKKVAMFLVVIIAQEIDMLTNGQTPIREIVIFFYVANEGLSIIENLSQFIKLPEEITKYFKEKGGDK